MCASTGIGISFCLAVAPLLARPAPAAPPAAPEPKAPIAYVMVYASGASWDSVYLAFPQQITLARAQELLRAVAQQGGWAMRNVRVRNYNFISIWDEYQSSRTGRPARGCPQTLASCIMSGVVNYRTGWLPLEPFARALSTYPRLHVAFTVNPGFPFQGPASFGNKAVQVMERQQRLPFAVAGSRQTAGAPASQVTYSYDVELSTAKLPAGAFPAEPTGAAARQQVASRRGANTWLLLGVALLLALAVGLAAYAYFSARERAAGAAASESGPNAEKQ